MSEHKDDIARYREQMAQADQFEAEIAPLRTAAMQAIMLERQDERIQKMSDAFDEMANTITRLEAERFHLQTQNILLQAENSNLQAENSNLRTQVISLEVLNLKFQKVVYEGVGRTQKKEGCLVLLVAGLSAFSLFTIYQI